MQQEIFYTVTGRYTGSWTASTNSGWITATTVVATSNPGEYKLTVGVNENTTYSPRSGSVKLSYSYNGSTGECKTITVNQAAKPCTCIEGEGKPVASTLPSIPQTGLTSAVSFTATVACGSITVTHSNPDWATITTGGSATARTISISNVSAFNTPNTARTFSITASNASITDCTSVYTFTQSGPGCSCDVFNALEFMGLECYDNDASSTGDTIDPEPGYESGTQIAWFNTWSSSASYTSCTPVLVITGSNGVTIPNTFDVANGTFEITNNFPNNTGNTEITWTFVMSVNGVACVTKHARQRPPTCNMVTSSCPTSSISWDNTSQYGGSFTFDDTLLKRYFGNSVSYGIMPSGDYASFTINTGTSQANVLYFTVKPNDKNYTATAKTVNFVAYINIPGSPSTFCKSCSLTQGAWVDTCTCPSASGTYPTTELRFPAPISKDGIPNGTWFEVQEIFIDSGWTESGCDISDFTVSFVYPPSHGFGNPTFECRDNGMGVFNPYIGYYFDMRKVGIYVTNVDANTVDGGMKALTTRMRLSFKGTSCYEFTMTQNGKVKCSCDELVGPDGMVAAIDTIFPMTGGTQLIASAATYGCGTLSATVDTQLISLTVTQQRGDNDYDWIYYWYGTAQATSQTQYASLNFYYYDAQGKPQFCSDSIRLTQGQMACPCPVINQSMSSAITLSDGEAITGVRDVARFVDAVPTFQYHDPSENGLCQYVIGQSDESWCTGYTYYWDQWGQSTDFRVGIKALRNNTGAARTCNITLYSVANVPYGKLEANYYEYSDMSSAVQCSTVGRITITQPATICDCENNGYYKSNSMIYNSATGHYEETKAISADEQVINVYNDNTIKCGTVVSVECINSEGTVVSCPSWAVLTSRTSLDVVTHYFQIASNDADVRSFGYRVTITVDGGVTCIYDTFVEQNGCNCQTLTAEYNMSSFYIPADGNTYALGYKITLSCLPADLNNPTIEFKYYDTATGQQLPEHPSWITISTTHYWGGRDFDVVIDCEPNEGAYRNVYITPVLYTQDVSTWNYVVYCDLSNMEMFEVHQNAGTSTCSTCYMRVGRDYSSSDISFSWDSVGSSSRRLVYRGIRGNSCLPNGSSIVYDVSTGGDFNNYFNVETADTSGTFTVNVYPKQQNTTTGDYTGDIYVTPKIGNSAITDSNGTTCATHAVITQKFHNVIPCTCTACTYNDDAHISFASTNAAGQIEIVEGGSWITAATISPPDRYTDDVPDNFTDCFEYIITNNTTDSIEVLLSGDWTNGFEVKARALVNSSFNFNHEASAGVIRVVASDHTQECHAIPIRFLCKKS